MPLQQLQLIHCRRRQRRHGLIPQQLVDRYQGACSAELQIIASRVLVIVRWHVHEICQGVADARELLPQAFGQASNLLDTGQSPGGHTQKFCGDVNVGKTVLPCVLVDLTLEIECMRPAHVDRQGLASALHPSNLRRLHLPRLHPSNLHRLMWIRHHE